MSHHFYDIVFTNWALLLFNVLNALWDSKARINKGKLPNHGLNLSLYICLIAFMVWLFVPDEWYFFIPCAGFARQTQFEPLLNVLRKPKKSIFYQSPSPTAFFDKLEQRIFGKNGKLQLLIYSTLWITLLILQFLIQ